jgi:2-polyprenyl-3-methyl-5-hydroxy-6-metoxy-1,4-benzoquinol methylase
VIDVIKKTLDFYNRNALKLAEKYNRSTPYKLQQFVLNSIPNKNCKILEIGFGSGRELKFLLKNGFNVWGVDGSKEFVKLAKSEFPEISEQLFQAYLPELKLPSKYVNFFDVVICIAVLMHIPKNFHQLTAKNIAKYLKTGGILILSYSLGTRNEKERFFEKMEPKEAEKAFSKTGFKKIKELITQDSQKREIEWIIELYKLKNKD